MRRLLFLLITSGVLSLLYAGCDFAGEDIADQTVVLTGRVVTESGDPIPDAFVRVPALGLSQYTDDKGLYRFEAEADSTMDVQVIASGGGWGHGIGMCQVGALGRARAGQSYRDILVAYYPGTRISRLYR